MDRELRSAQIEMRVVGIEEAYDMVETVAAGKRSAVAEEISRNADRIRTPPHGTGNTIHKSFVAASVHVWPVANGG